MPRSPKRPTDGDADASFDAHNLAENSERFADEGPGRPIRGPAKRKALQLERLGEALVKLKPGQLARVPLPDDLLAAVKEAQRIWDKKAFGGYRRQIQFVGRIMRTVDAEPIAEALEQLKQEGTMASLAFQRAEHWRTRLLDEGDAAIDALCGEHGDTVERTTLRQCVRAAQQERARQATSPQTPSTQQKKLFRLLREVFEPAIGATPASADDAAADAADDADA
jgi:ribosome-associated protein